MTSPTLSGQGTCKHCCHWSDFGLCRVQSGTKRAGGMSWAQTITTLHNETCERFEQAAMSKPLIDLGDAIARSLTARGHASCGEEAVRLAATATLEPTASCTEVRGLLACPFCSKHGEYVERPNPMSKWRHSVDCSSCGMSGPVEATKTDAIAAWNSRPGHDALVEALVEALAFYADERAWNEPPVQTVNHEIFGKAYQNQASKVRLDRGRIARAALALHKGAAS